jgi:hypothetical protein
MSETQGEQPFHGLHFLRRLRKKLIRTLRQGRTDLDDFPMIRHAQHTIAASAHALPQVGQKVGEQRQRAGLVLC